METKILIGILVLIGFFQSTHYRKKGAVLNSASPSAIEKFVRSKRPPLNEEEIKKLIESIEKASAEEGLDPALLTALLYRESGFNPKALSPSGAKGLGQLLDTTAKEVGVQNPFDIQENVLGTAKYLAKQIKRFGSDQEAVEKGLACYRIGCRVILESGTIPDKVKAFIQEILALRAQIHAL